MLKNSIILIEEQPRPAHEDHLQSSPDLTIQLYEQFSDQERLSEHELRLFSPHKM
jgi:hypothetical protein